jgi:hypothetical protein
MDFAAMNRSTPRMAKFILKKVSSFRRESPPTFSKSVLRECGPFGDNDLEAHHNMPYFRTSVFSIVRCAAIKAMTITM